jgi:hypothetical protein
MTSQTYNQGIVHLAAAAGGRPFCGSHRAIMVTTPSDAKNWIRVCAKCAAKLADMEARDAKKAQVSA